MKDIPIRAIDLDEAPQVRQALRSIADWLDSLLFEQRHPHLIEPEIIGE